MRVETADVLVVGCGTMGSAALWRLAARGADVVGVERFEPGHDLGSGHGESRIIRTAYYEGPHYVPLLREAFPLWRQLEQESGIHLLTMTGGLMIGRQETSLVSGALTSAKAHGLAYERLSGGALRGRYPQFQPGDGEVAIYEPDAGALRPEMCIQTAARRAVELGARLHARFRVDDVRVEPGGVVAETEDGAYRAGHLVLCAGAWNGKLLPAIARWITVERMVLTWFRARDPELFAPERFPVFMWERDGAQWYGLPTMDGQTVKVVRHRGGHPADPDTLDRKPHPEDLTPIERVVADTLPGLEPRVVRSQVCMYSRTPDEHFLIGSPRGMDRVTLLGGFSGHGFKFASILGDVAADLALSGSTTRPISSFDPDRFDGAGRRASGRA
jgi:sarcosine oxidase